MGLLQTILGKIAAGIIALAVIAGAISWWQAGPDARAALLHNLGRILAWIGIVAVLPWASFPLVGYVASKQNNSAGVALIAVLTIIEWLLLAWLFAWRVPGNASLVFAIVIALLAAVYNVLACDWLAEKLE